MSKFSYETDPSIRSDGRFWGKLDNSTLDTLGITSGRETHFISYTGGKRIAVQVAGNPEGPTIYLLHGSPGGRDDPSLDAPYLWHRKVQIVTFDRGGYEFSDPIPGRKVAESAKIVQHIADYLGKPPKYIIGRSGGASGALSCSELPDIERIAALVPLAPRLALGDSWYDDMTQFNVDIYQASEHFPDVAAEILDGEAQKIIQRQQTKFDIEPDRTRNIYRRDRSARSHAKALRFGPQGWIDDDIAAVNPWDYDPTNPLLNIKLKWT